MDAHSVEFTLLAQSLGWTVASGGWPDYLLYKTNGEGKITEVICVECKRRKTIAPHQLKILTILHNLGLQVRVWVGNASPKLGSDAAFVENLLTLNDFLAGNYHFEQRKVGVLDLGKQTIYNYRHQLNELRQILKIVDKTDPNHRNLYIKALTLARKLGEPVEMVQGKDSPIITDELADQALNDLEKAMYERQLRRDEEVVEEPRKEDNTENHG